MTKRTVFYEELEHVSNLFPQYRMKILLRDFNVICNDNEVRVANFATSEDIIFKSTNFSHRNIHKYTWTSLDGKMYNQTDHILIDKRQHSSVADVLSFSGADCDTDNNLVVATIGDILLI